jgi:hypothetical protein
LRWRLARPVGHGKHADVEPGTVNTASRLSREVAITGEVDQGIFVRIDISTIFD